MKRLLGFALVAVLGLVGASLWSGTRAEATDQAEEAQTGTKKMRTDAGAGTTPSTPTNPPPRGAAPKGGTDGGPMK